MGEDNVFLAIIGVGNVGKWVVRQIEVLSMRSSSSNFRLCYLSTSKKALYANDYKHINIADSLDELSKSSQSPLPPPELLDYLASAPSKAVLIDNTSSQDIANIYPAILRRGITIVTPNKKAFSGTTGLWRDVFAAAATSGAGVFHEATVGAGLPIISTLNDLVETGDTITKIEGVFSGTMSFLFNSFSPTRGVGDAWSKEVRKSKELGYTEPDPRDDLNGLDVARKLTILARLAGLDVDSPVSFPVQSLIPPELEDCGDGEEFMEKLSQFDHRMEGIALDAREKGKVLRYVGSIHLETETVKVGLECYDTSHPFAALKGSDNIISFHTVRYGSNPLIVQGAGAGGEVTAMGVTADLLKALKQIL